MNIFGKYIDDNEKVLKSLTKIYGIGRPTAEELCMTFGIGLDKKVKELSKDTWSILIKAAELGPYKYKDLLKDLQETDRGYSRNIQKAEGVVTGETSGSVNPLSEAIEVFVSKTTLTSPSVTTGLAEEMSDSTSYVKPSILINGKLRSQKVEMRALTDLRERLEAEKKMKSYRGLRHLEGLPVRGQRTSTNALTARKRKK